mmetsp:Transcript_160007/g.298598  ORF Transcript_160007/g.298598 Transcript_160007/m.298598 type:complete len:711 (-) Transcript_160007:87-2219(-)
MQVTCCRIVFLGMALLLDGWALDLAADSLGDNRERVFDALRRAWKMTALASSAMEEPEMESLSAARRPEALLSVPRLPRSQVNSESLGECMDLKEREAYAVDQAHGNFCQAWNNWLDCIPEHSWCSEQGVSQTMCSSVTSLTQACARDSHPISFSCGWDCSSYVCNPTDMANCLVANAQEAETIRRSGGDACPALSAMLMCIPKHHCCNTRELKRMICPRLLRSLVDECATGTSPIFFQCFWDCSKDEAENEEHNILDDALARILLEANETASTLETIDAITNSTTTPAPSTQQTTPPGNSPSTSTEEITLDNSLLVVNQSDPDDQDGEVVNELNETETTTTKMQIVVVTTTSTTTAFTPDVDCPVEPGYVPYDEFGNYTHIPGTQLLNMAWTLTCLPGYVPRNGREKAFCNARGELILSSCEPSECNSVKELKRFTTKEITQTTCNETLQQGQVCTWKCDQSITYQVYGYWTCFQGRFVGQPICTNREGRYWKVIWVLQKIIASMKLDIWCKRAMLSKDVDVNLSNATNAPFRRNISDGFAALFGLLYLDFSPLNIVYRGAVPWIDFDSRLWWAHHFDIDYGLVIWDPNTLEGLETVALELGKSQSAVRDTFIHWINGMHPGNASQGVMFCEVADLYYIVNPAPYETTMVAPDSQETDGAHPGCARPWLTTVLGACITSWVLLGAWDSKSQMRAPTPCRATDDMYRRRG